MLMLLTALAVSACSATAGGSKSLPFQLIDNAILVPVMVDGHGPFRFLLDTGASRSVLSARLTDRLGLAAIGRTRMLTPTGHRVRPIVTARVAIGTQASVRVSAPVLADDELTTGAVRLDGIVGQDVLAPLTYAIDYSCRVIDWHPAVPATAQRVPLSIANGRAVISVAEQDGGGLRLIPDTGSDSIVLFARDRRLPAATPLDVSLLRTVAGHRLVRRVQLTDWRIGSLSLRDQDAFILDAADAAELEADGLLALHLFSRVTFDAGGGSLWIER